MTINEAKTKLKENGYSIRTICNPIKLPPLESGGFWLKCLNRSLNI